MITVAAALTLLETWYDPSWAESWDSVGLVAGDRDARLTALHVAIDPTVAVAHEAADAGAQLLLTHHPLWLGGTERISGDKGRAFSVLAGSGCALFVAHTNADVANPGVSDALAGALGLSDVRPLVGQDDTFDQWVVHVPATHTEVVLDAVAAVGAGRVGGYDRCAFIESGTGTFRPRDGSSPYVGTVGKVERVGEDRLEFIAAPSDRMAIALALRAAHPYEEPSFTAIATRTPSRRGLGRVGELPRPMSLRDFVALVEHSLPATVAGIRATGDPTSVVRTVAVAGGSCLDLDGAAAASEADVFVTSDAKHHRAQEACLPIVDVPHWAGEWPWAASVGERLRADLPGVSVTVSQLVTDPWTMAAGDRVDRKS